jgi:glutaconate CoA-transferase subunit A
VSGAAIASDVDALAARIPDGALIGLPTNSSGVAMAATRALIRRGARDLRLVALPTTGLQADMLIGAGCVRSIEMAAVSLGEHGFAPRFRDAAENARIEIRDATCPALHSGMIAGEKGVPFLPIRGIIGSDILRHRPDWTVIDNPFAEDGGDPIVLVPAIRPDIALFHAPLADKRGNVWVGTRRELMTMAHASETTLVTVEEIVDDDLLADEKMAPGTLPHVYVSAVAAAPGGARPLGLPGRYPVDDDHVRAYAELAQTAEGFQAYLEDCVLRPIEAP